MYKIELTPSQLNRAKDLYDFGTLKNSITDGQSNIYGAMGEVMVLDFFSTRFPVKYVGSYDFDLLFDDELRVDVKTKRTTVEPLGTYNCSVAAYNTTQDCDMYIFCRVHEHIPYGYILGYCYKDDFYNRATFYEKGSTDPGTSFKFTADCYNLTVSELDKINYNA